MTTLVGSDRDSMSIFFDGAFYNFMNTSVMTEVNDFSALLLHDPTHDVDGCIMPVKKTGCRNDSYI